MLTGPFISEKWLGATDNFDEAKIVLMGLGFDCTASNKAGARFAPAQIRLESLGIEEYSPLFNSELENVKFFDAGDLELPFGNAQRSLEIIKKNTADVLAGGKKFFGVGGEHLVTLGEIQAYSEKFQNLAVIHFDAHTDLRDEYLGESLTHAGVMKKIADIIGFENILQIGIRSGLKEEFELMKKHGTLAPGAGFGFSREERVKTLEKFKGKSVFVTVDLDVLDPSIMSGTGTPEAGGFSYREFEQWLFALKELNVVGADVVELAPDYDPSKASTATACKVVREILMIL